MLVSFTLNWHCFIGEGKENLLIGFIREDNTLEWSRTHNANGCLKKNRSKTRRIIRLYIDFFFPFSKLRGTMFQMNIFFPLS